MGQRHLPVRIAPNPASDKVQVDFDPGLLPLELSIRDMAGKILFRKVFAQEQAIIEISHLDKGLYVMQVQGQGSSVAYGKIIKQ
jgi:hypothetical protein